MDEKPAYGIVMPKAIADMRKLVKEHEKYTDEELANVLTFLASLEVVFRGIPAYLPPIMRAALVANEIAPKVMYSFVNDGVIDPIALTTYLQNLSEKLGLDTDGDKPKFMN